MTSPAESVEGLLQLARARAQGGDAAGAGRTFAAALHLAEAHQLYAPTAKAQAWLAEIDVKRGRLDLARQRLEAAWSLCEAHQLPPEITAPIAAQLGQVWVFAGRLDAGVALMRTAVGWLRGLEQTVAADELELAVVAVDDRSQRLVTEAEVGSVAHFRARARRAQVQVGLGRVPAAVQTLCDLLEDDVPDGVFGDEVGRLALRLLSLSTPPSERARAAGARARERVVDAALRGELDAALSVQTALA